MTVEKKRMEILLTTPYWDAIEHLIDEGVYLGKQEIVRDALRIFFRTHGIPPFYPQEAED